MDLRNARVLLERLLEGARKRGALAADALWSHGVSRSFMVRDGELERSRSGAFQGMGLRILDSHGCQGVASLSDPDEDAPELLLDWVFSNAAHAEPEPDALFAQNPPQLPAMDLGLYDEALVSWTPEEQIRLCHEMEAQARRFDRRVKSVRAASVGSGWSESLMMNSFGVMCSHRCTNAGRSVSVLMEENGLTELGGTSSDGRSLSSVLAWSPAEEAVERTGRMLNASSLPSGRYTLVLEPEVTASLLEAVSDLFLASGVCKGYSLLKDRLGDVVASKNLTLIDDGRLYGAQGTAPFDGEGVATGRTTLVDEGVLTGYLCNLQYGKRLGMASTGNGSRDFASLPDVDTTNFFPMPGRRDLEDLLVSVEKAFCVTELMGLHTIDTMTGDFSLAARGLFCDGGQLRPISSVTIAGNLLDFLGKIREVGGDLRFYGHIGGCSMVVDDIAVAGV